MSKAAEIIKSGLVRDSLDGTPLAEIRRTWEEAASRVEIPEGINIVLQQIGGVQCMLHSPKPSSEQVIIYLHGGGLVEGSIITCREWCSRLALAAGIPVLSINYRLAPEHPYPAALHDVVAVFKSIVAETDFNSIASIGADSTGCLLALQSLVHLRDHSATLPGSCFFLSPSLDLTFSGESIAANKNRDDLVSLEVLQYCAKLYAGDQNVALPALSPLFDKLHGLPRMLVFVDESEVLLDDARRLKEQVRIVGGNVQLVMSQELWHVWPTWGDFPEAAEAVDRIVKFISQSGYSVR